MMQQLVTSSKEKAFKWPFASSKGKGYRGTVTPKGFQIKRVVSSDESRMPTIIGQFQATESGTAIHVKISIPLMQALLITGVLTGTGIATLYCIQQASSFWVPAGLFGVALLYFWLGFRIERAITFNDFKELFSG